MEQNVAFFHSNLNKQTWSHSFIDFIQNEQRVLYKNNYLMTKQLIMADTCAIIIHIFMCFAFLWVSNWKILIKLCRMII